MARQRKDNKKEKIILLVLTVILAVLIAVIIILSFLWKDKSDGNGETIKSESTKEVTTTKTPEDEESENDGIIKTYTALFSVNGEENQSKIDKAIEIIENRMEEFGMKGEAYYSDGDLVVNVGLTSETQEAFLKYIATPGKFSIKTEDGMTVLKQSDIEEVSTDIETLDTDKIAGSLTIKVKDSAVEGFKNSTTAAVDKIVSVEMDGVSLKAFKWSSTIESGTLVLRCFNSEELVSLGVVLKYDTIPITLVALTAQTDETAQ